MQSTFWSNTIWYILLGIVTLIQLFIVFRRSKNRRHTAAMFFIISGITFCIEAVIFCFLKAYDYFPLIIPQSPIDDQLAGNLFSQYSITTTALTILVFHLNYYWLFIFGGIYGLIEESFLRLGIYKQNWYQTWLTIIGLPCIFWVAGRIYHSRRIVRNGMSKYVIMAFGLYSLHMPIVFWVQILTGIVRPSTTFLADPMSSYALISLFNLLMLSIGCMVVYFSKRTLLWKALLTLAMYGVLYLAEAANLLVVREGWFLIFATLDIFGMYLSIVILDRLLSSRNEGI